MQRATTRRDGDFVVLGADYSLSIALRRQLASRWDLAIVPASEDAYHAVGRRKHLAAAVIAVEDNDAVELALLDFIRQRRPALPVLVLARAADPATLNHAQRQGAEYACMPDVIESLRAFACRVVVGHHLTDKRAHRYVETFAQQHNLSVRQTEILALAVADFSREESATRMGVSVNTYKTEARHLLKKTGRKNVAELAAELRAAVRRGL